MSIPLFSKGLPTSKMNQRIILLKVTVAISEKIVTICLSVTVSISKIRIARTTRHILSSKTVVSVPEKISVRSNFAKSPLPFPRKKRFRI